MPLPGLSRRSRTDNLSPEARRRAMAAVKARDTTPERRVAGALRSAGVRFRRYADLPGKPDFVLLGLRAALFVQGCFWHGHGCRSRIPMTNRAYWLRKLAANKRRDRRVRRQLNRLGWTVLVLWECQLKGKQEAVGAVSKSVARASRALSVSRRGANDSRGSAGRRGLRIEVTARLPRGDRKAE